MTEIDTIVWDVGRVLIEWEPSRVYQDDPRFDQSLSQVWTDRVIKQPWPNSPNSRSWDYDTCRGRTIAATLAERIAGFPAAFPEMAEQLPDYADLLRKYYQQWERSIDRAVPGMFGLRDEFRQAGYRTYALTNFSTETWPIGTTTYPQLLEFDGVVMSGAVRMAKPDEEIYHHLFRQHDISSERAVFIDDSQANIDTARRLGMKGILFRPDFAQPHRAVDEVRRNLAILGVTLQGPRL